MSLYDYWIEVFLDTFLVLNIFNICLEIGRMALGKQKATEHEGTPHGQVRIYRPRVKGKGGMVLKKTILKKNLVFAHNEALAPSLVKETVFQCRDCKEPGTRTQKTKVRCYSCQAEKIAREQKAKNGKRKYKKRTYAGDGC